jgi:hypothetical protein
MLQDPKRAKKHVSSVTLAHAVVSAVIICLPILLKRMVEGKWSIICVF